MSVGEEVEQKQFVLRLKWIKIKAINSSVEQNMTLKSQMLRGRQHIQKFKMLLLWV